MLKASAGSSVHIDSRALEQKVVHDHRMCDIRQSILLRKVVGSFFGRSLVSDIIPMDECTAMAVLSTFSS